MLWTYKKYPSKKTVRCNEFDNKKRTKKKDLQHFAVNHMYITYIHIALIVAL